MQQKGYTILAIFILLIGGLFAINIDNAQAAKKPTYTISPGSKTYQGNLMNYSTYNKQTKHYYLIRSYLEQLEKTGGGTLVLKKGTYTITNVLYVPSNVTIKLQNGVKIVKGTKTGTSKFGAAKSIFQFVKPSKSGKKGAYGGYKGEKNISILGYGNATIDLNYVKDSIAIIAGHNTNITINNIHFTNMYSGHFIEIDATKNAKITNNSFKNSKASSGKNKEAINIDTPDKATKGWNSDWSKYDKTPNDKMLIENNTFYDLDRAIGTHKYSEGKYHNQITIRNNKIEKTREDAIRVMNWSNSTIEHNVIKDVHPDTGNNNRGILVSGAHNPTFQHNVFVSVPRAMQFMVWKNNGAGSDYALTYNKLSEKNIAALKTNTVIDYVENVIRINHEYNRYDNETTDRIEVKTGVFSDLLDGEGGFAETIALVEKGIITGYKDFTFKPYNELSRQHVALMLTRTKSLGLTPPKSVAAAVKKYSDVDVDHMYAKEIATVTEAGIFGGSNGEFKPDNTMTRAQMATVLVGAFDLQDTGEEVALIDLHKIDPAHRKNVEILAQHKITIGKQNADGERYFDASGKLNRVQFTQMLHRTLELN